MKVKLIGDVYLFGCALTALTVFTIDCINGKEVSLHLIGIIIDIPALAYCTFRLFLDLHDYLMTRKFTNSKISR
jgi:hypothetical protein